jgi:hypothetical protein
MRTVKCWPTDHCDEPKPGPTRHVHSIATSSRLQAIIECSWAKSWIVSQRCYDSPNLERAKLVLTSADYRSNNKRKVNRVDK